MFGVIYVLKMTPKASSDAEIAIFECKTDLIYPAFVVVASNLCPNDISDSKWLSTIEGLNNAEGVIYIKMTPKASSEAEITIFEHPVWHTLARTSKFGGQLVWDVS